MRIWKRWSTGNTDRVKLYEKGNVLLTLTLQWCGGLRRVEFNADKWYILWVV